jgi:hypothetical protein
MERKFSTLKNFSRYSDTSDRRLRGDDKMVTWALYTRGRRRLLGAHMWKQDYIANTR